MTFMISLSLWLFIPFKDANADISKYSDSEYYSVIQKLHAAGYRPPRYKNNFQKYVKNVEDIFTIKYPEEWKNKHILLVDDVITSGSTIFSCMKHTSSIRGCRVSVFSLGWAHN